LSVWWFGIILHTFRTLFSSNFQECISHLCIFMFYLWKMIIHHCYVSSLHYAVVWKVQNHFLSVWSFGNIFYTIRKLLSRDLQGCIEFTCVLLSCTCEWISFIIFVYYCLVPWSEGPESLSVCLMVWQYIIHVRKAIHFSFFKGISCICVFCQVAIVLKNCHFIIFVDHCIMQQSKGSESLIVCQMVWQHIIHH